MYRKNDNNNVNKFTEVLVVKFEKSWFLKTQYVPQSKHHHFQNKYCEEILEIVSKKKFDEDITINHLVKLLNNNKNNLIDDLDNVKKVNNYWIKIQDSMQGFDLSLCIIITKTQEGKMNLCIRTKKNGLAGFVGNKEDIIVFIKREISFDLFGELIL